MAWIVVGTDFSECAHTALGCALRLAQATRAGVALVSAYEDDGSPDDIDALLMTQLEQEVAASVATRLGVHVEPLVRRGAPWEKILNVATEYGAEIVVVGRCGQRGVLRSALLGTVVTRVLALSSRSVLVVGPSDA
jgi:nucleotide-binding universal stress UspA family protein